MPDRRDDELPAQVFDQGLQQERTALAWDRTALAMIVAGALFLRGGGAPYADVRHLPGYAAVATGVWLLWRASRTYEQRHGTLRREESVTEPGWVRVVALIAVVLSLSSLVLLITSF